MVSNARQINTQHRGLGAKAQAIFIINPSHKCDGLTTKACFHCRWLQPTDQGYKSEALAKIDAYVSLLSELISVASYNILSIQLSKYL
jgi:hypothetical protein